LKRNALLKRSILLAGIVLALWLSGVRSEPSVAFVNGNVLTLDDANTIVEALLIIDGKVAARGSTAEIRSQLTPDIAVVDLNGATLMPGFIDAHSHFPASGLRTVSVDLTSPPAGRVDSMESLLSAIQTATESSDSEHAVYLWHHSGHMGVANSAALTRLSINEDYVAPEGGYAHRDLLTGELTGLLQERAAPNLSGIVRKFGLAKQWRVLTDARHDYLSAGVTTVQNGYASPAMIRFLKTAKWLGVIPQRVVVWPAYNREAFPSKVSTVVQDNFDFYSGAIKILVDGSPQGMTAYMSKPFFDLKGKADGYRGLILYDAQSLNKLVADYHSKGYQLALHGNGDAAMNLIIDAVSAAESAHPRPDARHILVHAQTIRRDQLQRLKGLSLSPSFFTSHTFNWGDWHRLVSLGEERAVNISPAKWADDLNIPYSIHSDAPVTTIDPLQLVWSATERKTRSGYLLGGHQRIDRLRALRAVTIDAAWQNNLERAIGSLEVGKQGDLVVLSANPLDADDVREIKVLETYIGGIPRFSLVDRYSP